MSRRFWGIGALFVLCSPFGARAQLKPIAREELLQHFKAGLVVDKRAIRAIDIVEALRSKQKLDIRINRSYIAGTLNLSKLPLINLADLDLPQDIREVFSSRNIRSLRAVKHDLIILNTEVPGVETQRRWKLGSSIEAQDTIFFGTFIFFLNTVGLSANFTNAVFRKEANFTGTIFQSRVDFSHAIFEQTSFWRTSFSDTSFSNAIFRNCVSFFEASFKEFAHFEEADFEKQTDFTLASFNGTPVLAAANFHLTRFRDDAIFRGALVDNGWAIFSDSVICGKLILDNIALQKGLLMRGAVIEAVTLSSDRLLFVRGKVDFRRAKIARAHFQNVVFADEVDFTDATFLNAKGNQNSARECTSQVANIDDPKNSPILVVRDVLFNADVSFLRTSFDADTIFQGIGFRGAADFTEAKFSRDLKHFAFSYVDFANLKLDEWDQLPDQSRWVSEAAQLPTSFVDAEQEKNEERVGGPSPLFSFPSYFGEVKREAKNRRDVARIVEARKSCERLSHVFGRLEKYFSRNDKLSDANHAKYFEAIAERQEARGLTRLLQELRWGLWGFPFGYGTHLVRSFAFIALTVVFFALLYCFGSLQHKDIPKRLILIPRSLPLPGASVTSHPHSKVAQQSLERILSALKLSLYLTCKIGYRDIEVSGKIMGLTFRPIVWAEWILGFYLLIGFAVTASNTVPFIKEIISFLKPLM